MADSAAAAADVPIHAGLQRIHDPVGEEARPDPGRLPRSVADLPLQSVVSGRVRSAVRHNPPSVSVPNDNRPVGEPRSHSEALVCSWNAT